ncbi:hypothetical protein EDD21DRAFT_898 [Dissophora ornata]|nr:hypothetical protein EDD21DRAFT_898 [Dissophora ornata]
MSFWKGIGMGRKLSLSNLALAVSQDAILADIPPANSTAAMSLITPPIHASEADQLSIHSIMSTTVSQTLTQGAPPTVSFSETPFTVIADGQQLFPNAGDITSTDGQRSDPRVSTLTTDTSMTFVASPFISSSSLSSVLHGESHAQKPSSSTSGAPAPAPSPMSESLRPISTCSTLAEGTNAKKNSKRNSSNDISSSRPSFTRPRSRAADILLNLEASSNDTRFQGILHNTIALDHFRQFCFQEYSIENLLFWMDVELLANPSQELLRMGHHRRRGGSTDETAEVDAEKRADGEVDGEGGANEVSSQMKAEEFAVQQARYIYLTYIDSCAPLQVNLSDESRTDIPWPIVDYKPTAVTSSAPPQSEKKEGFMRVLSYGKDQSKREEDVVSWPLDRHMFDGAQEHTYQLMKGHTLVRFEDSDLWKAVQKIMHEQPEEYAKATIQGPLSSHYSPDKSVILSAVTRSRSRHPSAKPQTLYNWNNSTSDLDRSHDKEEALAQTMSQYFGPIPASIRHPSRVILGLGRLGDDHFEDGFEYFDAYDSRRRGEQSSARNRGGIHDSKRSSTSSVGTKTNIFRKRFSGGIAGRSKSHSSEEILDLYHDDNENDLTGIDSVENGRRTTRWMVAGYFNDQVRLTAAQRKRLLRRNNKLTKFFGSRIDGTLRPVEDPVDKGLMGSSGRANRHRLMGSSSAPSLGSPLAYALSSSMIHDMDKKGIAKKKSNSSESNMAKRGMMGYGGGSGSEVFLLLPGTKPTNSKSANLLQKFRRNSPELEVEYGNGSRGHKTPDPPGSSRGSLFKRASGNKGADIRHYRSVTAATDAQHHGRILAHPHPLWSGSLSDQEGSSSAAYGRWRKMSVLSVAGNSTRNATGSVTPTTPTSAMAGLYGLSKGAVEASGASLDRHAMTSRRKKADKLSTFFGAQLTTLELSTQLPMEHEDGATEVRGGNRNSNEGSSETQRAKGPTYSSVNKLSNKERTTLWKRNKKLRGLLGESLTESAVALALTNPLLQMNSSPSKLRSAGGRRASNASKLQRRTRRGSSHSRQGPRQGGYEGEDAERGQREREENDDEYEDEAPVDGEDDMISISSVSRKSSGANRGRSRIATRPASARHRRLSIVSTSSRGRPRTGSNRSSGMSRSVSNYSLESFLTVDSLVSSSLRDYERYDDNDDGGNYIGNSADRQSSPRRRKSSVRPLGLAGLSVNTHGVGSDSGLRSPNNLSRFNRKKKMDKIHQFLGDRVPEQDLWMGAVGRQKTQEMLDLNLLSAASSAGGGSPSPSAFGKHGFPRRSGKSGKSGSRVAEMTSGVMLESPLSDPPTHPSGHLGSGQQQQPQQGVYGFSITNRLRQQLASPVSPNTSGTGSISGIEQPLSVNAGGNAYSSPATSSPGSPSSSTTGPGSGTAPAIAGLPMLSQDGDGDEDEKILPRLRAMSDKDQERFLKRAGKLEKYFGEFPPSSLLENSLTTFPIAGDSKVDSSSTKGAVVDTEEGSRWAEHRHLAELAGLLPNVVHDYDGSDGGSKKYGKSKETARTSQDRTESTSVSETQFSVEI